MVNVNYFVRTTKTTGLVNINIRFNVGRKIIMTTSINKKIDLKDWDINNIKSIKDEFESIDREEEKRKLRKLKKHLRDLKAFIEDEYELINIELIQKNTSDRKKWLETVVDKFNYPENYKTKVITFQEYLKDYIKELETTKTSLKTNEKLKYRSRREYHHLLTSIENFAKEINIETSKINGFPNFDNINMEFYYNYVEYLRNLGLADNTIGKKIQTLKTVLHSATAENLNTNNNFTLKRFKTLSEDTINVYLNQNEVQQLYNHDFSKNTRLERVRDLFIVGCWTGIRFGDLTQLTPEKIDGKFISITQNKTGEDVVIPIHPSVKEILKKYDGVLPNKISNQKFNDYLKEACKIADIDSIVMKKEKNNNMKYDKKYYKYELVASHTARRTFCTNAYEMDIPTLTIMAISGHRTEKSFLKYLKMTSKTHAKKMLKVWEEKGINMRAVN